MKKAIRVVIALSICVGLVACKKETVSNEVIFWHSATDEHQIELNKLVDEFNQTIGANKNVTVLPIFQGTYIDAGTKLRAVLSNDMPQDLPDIMQLDATGVTDYLATSYAYTVDDAIADFGGSVDDIMGLPLQYWAFHNVQQGLPFSMSTTVMYYNKTLQDQTKLLVPSTFSDIISSGELMMQQAPPGVAIHPFAHVPNTPTLTNWIAGLPESNRLLLDENNGRDGIPSTLVAADNGTLVAFLTEWKRMYDAGVLLNQSSSLKDYFFAGQLGYYIASTSQLEGIVAAVGDSFELGVANFPVVNDTADVGASISGSGVFMFDRVGGSKEAAWLFMQYLTSADSQVRLAKKSGYIPVSKEAHVSADYLAYLDQNPLAAVGIAQIEQTDPRLCGIIIGPSRDFYLEIEVQVSSMLENDKSPELTAGEMKSALEGLLQQYKQSNQ